MKKLLPILFCLLFALTASAAAYTYDNADLYTPDEETEIAAAAEQVYTNSGLYCVILTDHGIGDILAELPIYAGDAVDMALLTIDMSAREFYLYQYNAEEGESAFRISSVESDEILDGILPEMADGDYFNAALTYLEMTEKRFNNDEAFDPALTGDDYEYIEYPTYDYPSYDYPYEYPYEAEVNRGFPFEVIFMMAFVGAVAGGISVLCVWLSYKKKVHGATYPLGQFAKLDLIDSRDTFINTTKVVTRIPDPPSNSGGHHRSGGFRSGGGGFRGGGGARMGGRKF